ncbi:GEVED domain-containing protein [Arenibacter sp. F26102]|uniref:immunoglobulin domain-containing protein n=1 Tax=Arenibacter sp. F26102 TaxID=2926416 RepID=UPI001FF385B2|nr:GEVED domain-containing protein [Arenibacter sp. F26102]MCK0147291.1 GEVED domain-containing protein [Arenibacter sp. F26102]
MRFPSLHKILFGLLMILAGIASAQTTITSQVAQGNDDAEEQVSNGNMDLGSSDLELTSDGGTNQYVGIRFQNINIPQGTTILSASIQFTTDETDTGSTSVTIRGEDTNNASIFSNSNYNISSRTLTSASVSWNSIPSWNSVGQAGANQRTPDLTAIVQEIVNRGGWVNGNAMAFVINGSGERTAEAYNGDSSKSPVLSIVADFTPPPLTTLPTIVPNLNRGLPYIYYMSDNRSELYSVAPDPTASPLPSPTITNITYGGSPIIFSGEGGGYRSTDRQVYVFEGDEPTPSSDMYSIDPITGVATLVKTGIVPGHVEGAEFYINNNTGEEILVIVYNNGTNGGADRITAINPNVDGSLPAWSPYAGFPVVMSGARSNADGISWNPDTAEFYIQNDNNVDYYTVDITTGVTAYAFTTSSAIDGEGITYASDGTNYIEDENNVGLGRTIFIVNTSTGELTPAAQLGSTGDVESIMGNLGTRNDAGDAPASYGFAAHILPVLTTTPITIYLGSVPPDSENPFMNFSIGNSDDNTGDDEDGVFSGGIDFSGQVLDRGTTKVIDITTNGAGVLNAWIDFNRDGDFEDSGEQIATDLAPSGGSITLNVTVPGTATIGTSYARFRFSSDTGLPAGNSEASDGEAEDYQIIIQDDTACPSGNTMVEYTSVINVYASGVIVDDNVGNQNNALGNNDGTNARFNNENDELVLEMSEAINSGDSVTVYGEDGDDFDIWISSSATGPWTQVGNNAQLDFTFTSPIDWLYIRFKSSDDSSEDNLSYVDASKTVSTYSCELDNDGDGTPDDIDLDNDNDGIPDSQECEITDSGHDGSYPASDFSLNISSANPNNISGSHILNEITLKGRTFGDFIAPDSYSASYNNINATGRVYLSDHTVNSYDYYNNPNFSDQIIPSFQSRDLNYYHAMDNSNYTADNYTLLYDSPITSTGEVTLIITERNGNNPYFVEALDVNGNVLGSISVNLTDYVDSGHKVNNYQSGGMFVALFPIDDIAPLGSKVRGLRMTFPGATSDGPDGKVFFFGDFSAANCDSDNDGIPNHLDLDSDNDGIYDAVEAGHGQAHTNGVVNSGYGANGLANIVETSPESGIINYTIRNTDGDAVQDFLDLDSDEDGCNDAMEAYADIAVDGDTNGYYGTGIPPSINSDGSVSSAAYPVPADGDANGTPDYREAGAAPLINTQPADESICEDGDTSFSVVASNVDTYQWQFFNGSIWEDLTDSGIHSGSNTNQLNITNAQNSHNGSQYRVIVSSSSHVCDPVTSNSVTLTVHPRPTITVSDSPSCVFRLFQPTTYELEVTVSSGTVTSTAGTVTNTSGNVWEIVNVPSGTNITITVTDANGCSEDLPVTAPNCSCPVVNAPTSGGNQSYCAGDTVPTITANVGFGQTVDWYDSASGGTLLLLGSTNYTPLGPGTYYAEARNTATNCKSATRTGVSVTEDTPSTATIGPDKTVFVGETTSFTATTGNADIYQWQFSTDGGGSFLNLTEGADYTGTNTKTLTIHKVDIDQNNYLFRILASKSGSSCSAVASSSALLTVQVKTVITNRRITYRVKKN